MIHKTMAVPDGDTGDDLIRRGLSLGPTIKCSECDVSYCIFYNSAPATPPSDIQAADTTGLQLAITSSHPNHAPGRMGVDHSDMTIAS